jgi:CheY-like chemotaxis protein
LANNGLEALELYKKNSYDLILMDEQMPVMDGNESIKKILAYEVEKGWSHTPISALTANVIKGARERGLLSGFDSFLGKPIVIKELERVFLTYLKINATNKQINSMPDYKDSTIEGIDTQKLSEELMLTDEELVMLLGLFIKKMKKTLPELQNAIKQKDYEKIALTAHSIKGSSGNFRIESLQSQASELEQMAKSENSEYDYMALFKQIKERVEEIKIS